MMSAQNPHPCVRPSPGVGVGVYIHLSISIVLDVHLRRPIEITQGTQLFILITQGRVFRNTLAMIITQLLHHLLESHTKSTYTRYYPISYITM